MSVASKSEQGVDTVTAGSTASSNNWRTCEKSLIEECSPTIFPFDRTDNEAAHLVSEWTEEAYQSSLSLYDKLMDCQDSYITQKLHESLKYLDGAYRLYGPQHVIGSYNGGKDAVAILHLMRAAHAHYYRTQEQKHQSSLNSKNADKQAGQASTLYKYRPRVIYFDNEKEFPEIVDLLTTTTVQYDLDMLAFEQGITFPDGLRMLVERSSPQQLAFVLGTRTSDPNAMRQGHFAPSSSYMPPFMRVNPILDWTYGHVWHFLRLFQLPYCSLYDLGYTSLGNVDDTYQCPSLRKPPPFENEYWPAYMLDDWNQERAGRLSKEELAAKREAAKAIATEQAQPEPEATTTSKAAPTLQPSLSNLSVVVAAGGGGSTTTNNTTATDAEATSVCSSTNTDQQGGVVGSTVGLLIIGDEILKGLCNDTNTYAAATALRSNGLLLSRVVVVPDEHDDIVQEIHRLQKEVDIIITSGGVGATHDDVTMRAVASSLHWPLVYHEELGEFIKQKMNLSSDDNISEAQRKMATLPKYGKLRYLAGPKEWPTLQCRNIYVLPGVPQFFQSKVLRLAEHLATDMYAGALHQSITFKVVLSVEETSIVNTLNDVVSKHPNVSIGSYPFVDHPDYKTVVTIEGKEGPSLFKGDTRISIRKRSELFLRSVSASASSTGGGDGGDQQQTTTTVDSPESKPQQEEEGTDMISSKMAASSSYSSLVSPSKSPSAATATMAGLFTKEEMDLHVKLALADLIAMLPEGSVLRTVANDDGLQ